MFTKKQEQLLNNFAEKSDNLFDLGIITTDSFTGEIGEYIVCSHFKLKKTKRVTRAVDGISKTGERFQVKAKVCKKNKFNYTIKNLETKLFDTLVIIYFDNLYKPIRLLIVPSNEIKNKEIRILSSNISNFDTIDGSKVRLPLKSKIAISEFAIAYNNLEEYKIIRSRRIVGDIGEFYASRRLNLMLSENKNEKGIDARNDKGLTFEIKTRRVYESGRRESKTRRLNNLVGKTADYLIVVTIDKAFKCSGMWLIPMQNLVNAKSANLKVVNTTIGAKNLIPSRISWLRTGEKFQEFDALKPLRKKAVKSTVISKKRSTPKRVAERKNVVNQSRSPVKQGELTKNRQIQVKRQNSFNAFGGLGCFIWGLIIIAILWLIGYFSD